jgi:hypothetical protein
VAVFICPACAFREESSERRERHQPRGCARCGFGFLFELLEDYYAGPRTALVVCDQQRRILAAGHAASAVTGFQERDLLGHDVIERLGLGGWKDGEDPAAKSLEWGVRVLGVHCTFRPNGMDQDRPATADFFPAYDDDGGLLLALTPA